MEPGYNDYLQVGDVIRSYKFAFGFYDFARKTLWIDGKTKKDIVRFKVDEQERLQKAAETGVIPPEYREEDFGSYDKNRESAEFVVEEARMSGGGMAQSLDEYPDGWLVTARRLKTDGTYDPLGEVINFYTTGFFTTMVKRNQITVIRKMQKKPIKIEFV